MSPRLAIVIALAGCYHPRPDAPCTIRCDQADPEPCPGDLTCTNGVCGGDVACPIPIVSIQQIANLEIGQTFMVQAMIEGDADAVVTYAFSAQQGVLPSNVETATLIGGQTTITALYTAPPDPAHDSISLQAAYETSVAFASDQIALTVVDHVGGFVTGDTCTDSELTAGALVALQVDIAHTGNVQLLGDRFDNQMAAGAIDLGLYRDVANYPSTLAVKFFTGNVPTGTTNFEVGVGFPAQPEKYWVAAVYEKQGVKSCLAQGSGLSIETVIGQAMLPPTFPTGLPTAVKNYALYAVVGPVPP